MTTMDYDLGDDAGELRKHLRQLISDHIPAGFLGACTDDPQDLATTETFCKLLATEGLLALACGRRSVRFRPALCLGRSDAGAALEIVRRSLRSL